MKVPVGTPYLCMVVEFDKERRYQQWSTASRFLGFGRGFREVTITTFLAQTDVLKGAEQRLVEEF